MVRETVSISKKTDNSYPKSVFFIISNEFCERFNYYGMRTILALYMSIKLKYDDDTSTVLFHMFTTLVYAVPLIGAIVADSYLGKFKTIFYLSIVYAIGSIVISVGAIPAFYSYASLMTVIGLLLIAIGTGGIKPCVSAFGGDQFKIPEQAKQLATFFSLFYFSINAGSLISTTLTPILREDVHCFGELDCFSLAFGVPGVLMVISLIIFVAGKPLYSIKKPTGNTFVMVSKCIGNAIKLRFKENENKEHWLDYSEPKYGKQLVDDVKNLMKILILYLPLPVFWALFDQQGSRWTFQATQMNGDIGIYTVKPDQMQVVNPLLILLFIPLFDYIVYPMLAKCGIKRPLQKLTLGGILAGIAFLVSGLVELELEKTYPIKPLQEEAQLRIFNGIDCVYDVNTNIPTMEKFVLNALGKFESKNIQIFENNLYKMEFTSTDENCTNFNETISMKPKDTITYFIKHNHVGHVVHQKFYDKLQKSRNAYSLVRILANTRENRKVEFRMHIDDLTARFIYTNNSNEILDIIPNQYDIYVDGEFIGKSKLQSGGIYFISITESLDKHYKLREHVIGEPNSLSMFWLIPQYVIITAGEVMFSITGLEFSFTQAPSSMKSVIQACWLLAVAFGNAIVVVIAEARIFESQAYEFFLFAGLMFGVMGVFVILAVRYNYRETEHSSESDQFALDSSRSLDDSQGITNKGFKNDC